MEHGIRRAFAGLQVEAAVLDDFVAREDNVAQHGKQQLANAADHLAVHERDGRRLAQRNFQTPILLDKSDLEALEALEHRPRVVHLAARIQHSQHASP